MTLSRSNDVSQAVPRVPTVLFFDSWTRGVHNFKQVADGMPKGSASFQLLHFGRLRDPQLPKRETLHGIPTADITAFPGNSLLAVLRSYHPDVVVDLNAWYLWDRALFACCRRLGVPIVYLQHGAMLEPEVMETACRENDARWRVRDYLSRLPKYASVIKWYLEGKCELCPTLSSLRVLSSLLLHPTWSTVHPPSPQELWPDLALVYAESEAERLMNHWQMPRERVRVVGNPELDAAFHRRRNLLTQTEREQVLRSLGLASGRPVVFYPDEGWAATGAFGWTVESTRQWYADLSEAAGRLGAQVLIRPRPADNDLRGPVGRRYRVKDLCEGLSNVAVSRDSSVCDAVEVADVVVGMMSTVLETAVVMCRPILVPAWGFLGSTPGASAFVRYEAARVIPSRETLVEEIRRALVAPKPVISPAFARQRLGPLDGNAIPRISAAILGAASGNATGEIADSKTNGAYTAT